jgi:hypothetical protein
MSHLEQLDEQLQSAPVKPKVDRWSASIFASCLEDDPACDWRRHVRHATRIVLGFLSFLSAPDPERFAWPKWRSISANAERLGVKLGRSQVFAILALLESNGVISRVKRSRRGALRCGFIVHQHDEWTVRSEILGVCWLRSRESELRRHEAEHIERRRRRQARKFGVTNS